ncbi:MAG: glycoside hydrolase family 2 TIM barrel-domain containing protein [Pseudomonadota bacterium]
MAEPPAAPHDPFAHLHDETYGEATDSTVGADTMITMGGRTQISLDGEWRFVLDPFEEGLRQRWYAHEPSDPTGWQIPRDYDGSDWQTITVPGCWTTARPEWRHYEGAAWYLRWFDTPSLAPGERLFLRVGGALQRARVFLNGRFVGGHRGGSTPFFLEIGETCGERANRLQIMVENRRRADGVPMHHFDWFNDGGLFREVSLVVVPAVFIRTFQLSLTGEGIRLRARLSEPHDIAARLSIPDLGIEAEVAVTAGAVDTVIPATPDLWSPQSPNLYEVTLTCGADAVRERIGFRTLATTGEHILLNGAPIFLRGVCCHEDDAALGRTTSEADIHRRFAHVRALGANAVRLSHYPHHERVAEIADELGILLIAEVPVYWAIAFDNPETLADADNQLRELIARDINRASIIAWSIGNENADTDARYAFLKTLAQTAREADGTRLVTAACLINRTSFAVEDRIAAHLDVVGVNEYFGWYEPDFADLQRLLANSAVEKPLVISETGADALAGMHGAPGVLFSEAHQAHVFERQLEIVAEAPAVEGFFAWLLYDFRSERRQTGLQRGNNLKGLIAADKATRKRAFHTIAAAYRRPPFADPS